MRVISKEQLFRRAKKNFALNKNIVSAFECVAEDFLKEAKELPDLNKIADLVGTLAASVRSDVNLDKRVDGKVVSARLQEINKGFRKLITDEITDAKQTELGR